MFRSSAFAFLAIAVLASGTPAAPEGPDLDAALRKAQQNELPLVIDFFTEWCGPCKAFDRDLDAAGSSLSEALDDVVFVTIDAEKGQGVELAKRFRVTGYPTFVVLDPTGSLVSRWMGYGGPPHFLGQLESAMNEMITVEERRQRHARNPSADDAQKLASLAQGNGDYREAIALYREAEQLDPDVELSTDMVFAGYLATKNDESFHLDDFFALLENEVDDESPAYVWLGAYKMLCRLAGEPDGSDLRAEFIERAHALAVQSENFSEESREELEILALLHVEDDPLAATRRKKAALGDGWSDDPARLGTYAWWCYENRVDLEEARQWTQRGIELASSSARRAQLLYTASLIDQALGQGAQALALARRAVEEEPGNAHYRELVEELEEKPAGSEG